MYWWGLVLMVVVNAGTMVWRRRIAWWRVLLLVVFGVLLMVCDRCNILVDYDTWTSRGMPDWGDCRVENSCDEGRSKMLWSFSFG